MSQFIEHIGDFDAGLLYVLDKNTLRRSSKDQKGDQHDLTLSFPSADDAKRALYDDRQRIIMMRNNMQNRLDALNREIDAMNNVLKEYEPPAVVPGGIHDNKPVADAK